MIIKNISLTTHSDLTFLFVVGQFGHLCFVVIIRIVLELELSSYEEGAGDKYGIGPEADVVVPFNFIFPVKYPSASMDMGSGVVQEDAFNQHEDTPAKRPEHPLLTIVLQPVTTEVAECGRIC